MEQYIRITNSKRIYLSSSCSKFIGDRCDLYECGNVTALVSAPLGKFHLGKKSAQCGGKNLCSEELVQHLMNKYTASVGSSFSAWSPVAGEAAAVFFAHQVTEEEKQLVFGPRFTEISFSYQKRHGDWVFVEDRCISFTEKIREIVPRRLTLVGDGVRAALIGNPKGDFIFERGIGRKGGCIHSAALSDYCRQVFANGNRSVLFHARAIKNGICFALREEDLLPENCDCTLPKVTLKLSPDMFVSINSRFGIYLSSHAVRVLGKRMSIYGAEGWLALGCSHDDDLSVTSSGYQNYIFSAELQSMIAQRYPGAKKLYLVKRGSLFVLVQENSNLDKIPDFNKFYAVALSDESGCGFVAEPSRQSAQRFPLRPRSNLDMLR